MVRERRSLKGYLAVGLVALASLSTCTRVRTPERERELYDWISVQADREGDWNGDVTHSELRKYCKSRGFEPYFEESPEGPARDKFFDKVDGLYSSSKRRISK